MIRPNFRSPRTWVVLSITGLALVTGASVRLALYTDARKARAMRTPGAIVAVTQGSEPLVLGAVWQTVLGNALPELREKVGAARLEPEGIKSSSLVVWQNWGERIDWSGPPPRLSVELFGDRGESLSTAIGGDLQWVGLKLIPSFEITNFPRRGKQVRIRFPEAYPGVAAHPDVVMPNPAMGAYPTWSPVALPAKQHMGDLEVTLAQFMATSRSADGTFGHERTALKLHVREHGRPADGFWAVEKTLITDPTGNFWENAISYTSDPDGFNLDAVPLIVEEPAYRIQVELARVDNFPREEVCRFGNLRCPAPGQVMPLSRVVKLQGCTVELTHLLGDGAQHDLGWSSGGATAAVRIIGPNDRLCLRNATPEFRDYDVSETASAGVYCVSLGERRVGAPFTLELALTPRRSVTFLAHVSRPRSSLNR